jgi:hypothetical protein
MRTRQLHEPVARSTIAKIEMKKPNVRGPSPSRKAHLALRNKLNRKSKTPPLLPAKSFDKARPFRRNEVTQDE